MHYDSIRSSYYLRKWRYYETARHDLDQLELRNAKIFFNALKRLNDEKRKLLIDVYYRSEELCSFNEKTGYYHSLKPIQDQVMAKKYQVTSDRFANMRRLAQDALQKEMQRILADIGETCVFRLNKHLYLVGLLDNGKHSEQFILGASFEASKFTDQADKERILSLQMLGFEKVPIHPNEYTLF